VQFELATSLRKTVQLADKNCLHSIDAEVQIVTDAIGDGLILQMFCPCDLVEK